MVGIDSKPKRRDSILYFFSNLFPGYKFIKLSHHKISVVSREPSDEEVRGRERERKERERER